ncbi:biotin--[acetyl-CoA-carboxylase] ligase [bacterium]|nr:biotin--[acetyl-CoA-carboxylase] ligase [bacterium]
MKRAAHIPPDHPRAAINQRGADLCFTVTKFDEVSSTSDVAKQLATKGASEGTVVVASAQSAGRGRRGRAWFSPRGGLYFTILLRPNVAPERLRLLAAASALAVFDAMAISVGRRLLLKWPNDIYLEGKKVGGILIETKGSCARIDEAFVGIGVNLQRPEMVIPPEVMNSALWLSDCASEAPSREGLLADILRSFADRYKELLSSGAGAIAECYNRRLLLMGRKLNVRCDGKALVGICRGINEAGALMIDDNGKDVSITTGEICSWQ